MSRSVKRSAKGSKKSIGIAFAVAGIVLLVICIAGVFKGIADQAEIDNIVSKDTIVSAKVSKAWKKTKYTGKKSTRRKVTRYHISAQYTYDDKQYINPDIDLGSKMLNVGDSVILYIDPDDPARSVYTGNRTGGGLNVSYFFVPAIIAFGFGIIGIFIIKGAKDNKKKAAASLTNDIEINPEQYDNNTPFTNGYVDPIFGRTPTDEELQCAQENSVNSPSEQRRQRAEMERYQDSRGFGSNYIDNPYANYEKGSDVWDDDLPPVYDEPPEYRAGRYTRLSPVAGKYDPNISYRSPDIDTADPISPFTSNDSDDEDGWGFLEK